MGDEFLLDRDKRYFTSRPVSTSIDLIRLNDNNDSQLCERDIETPLEQFNG